MPKCTVPIWMPIAISFFFLREFVVRSKCLLYQKTGSWALMSHSLGDFFALNFWTVTIELCFSLHATTTTTTTYQLINIYPRENIYSSIWNTTHARTALTAELRKLLDYGFPCSLALCIVKMQLLPLNFSIFLGQCVTAKVHTVP